MIKAFLFDYGGVITSGTAGLELSERLGEVLDIPQDQAWGLLGPLWGSYSRGKITEAQLWEAVETEFGQPIPVDSRSIWSAWDAHLQPLPEMLDLVYSLQRQDFTVGLLSNVIPNTAQDIREHGGYDAFDFLVLSCEVGYAKPDTEIYALALEKMPGIRPEEIVFIDDQERFLAPAKELGIQTILAKDARQIAQDIS